MHIWSGDDDEWKLSSKQTHVMCIPVTFTCLSCAAHLGTRSGRDSRPTMRVEGGQTATPALGLTDNAGIQAWGGDLSKPEALHWHQRLDRPQECLSKWPKLAAWGENAGWSLRGPTGEPVLSVEWLLSALIGLKWENIYRRIWWHGPVTTTADGRNLLRKPTSARICQPFQ